MKKILLCLVCLSTLIPLPARAHDAPRSIHVFVALCDNVHQGIVPVPPALGDGKNPRRNLYWGALYGVKTYFKNAPGWTLLQTIEKPRAHILERCIFKKIDADLFLVADAYNGEQIKETITDFLNSNSNFLKSTLTVRDIKIGLHANADLLAYIGHNGLMDFPPPPIHLKHARAGKDVIILACKSRPYFERFILSAGSNPLLLTNGLMAPEAYTLKSAIDGWSAHETNESIRLRAVKTYQHYQKTSFKAANKLFYTKTGP